MALIPLPADNDTSWSDWAGSLHNKVSGLNSAFDSAAAIKAALERGTTSTVMQVVGDSTTVGTTTAWPSKLGDLIFADYPNYSVWHRAWSETDAAYRGPVVLHEGPAGERRVRYTSGTPFTAAPAVVPLGDLDVRVKVALDDWTTGANQTLASQWDDTLRSWQFRVSGTGVPQVAFSTDGTAALSSVSATVTPTLVDGQAAWLRFTLDADNGAGSRVVTFYTSTDGQTWTTLGTPVTTAGAITLFNTSTPIRLGVIRQTGTLTFRGIGNYYWCEVLSGINGRLLAPPLPELWDFDSDTTTGYEFQGSPVVLIVNGGIGGTRIASWSDAAIVDKLHADHGAQLFFLNDGHNEGSLTQSAYRTELLTYVDNVLRAKFPTVPIVLLGQNPVRPQAQAVNGLSGYSPNAVHERYRRVQMIAQVASVKPGVTFVDTIGAFNLNDLSTLLATDGLHLSNAGWAAQAAEIYRQLFG